MPNIAEIKGHLLSSIANRYQSQSFRDLGDYIFSNHLFHSFDQEFADFLFDWRAEIRAYLSDPDEAEMLVQYCIRSTREFTYQRNQYINFTRQYDELVEAEYRDLLLQIRKLVEAASSKEDVSQTLSTILQRHHERLRLILASYCAITAQSDLRNNPLLQTVPCEEYSPRFQLQLLNIDLNKIQQPVLDIGCGAQGNLVKFLREQGVDAVGLDRFAPRGKAFFQEDWFRFDYAQRRWRTVIAHQSLSTHFIFNYLNRFPAAEEYAALFEKILLNLIPLGTLHYAPGLPFFEEGLEEDPRYEITRKTIADNLFGLGEIAYSTQIRRV